MLFIDFLFYFSALHFKRINNGISWARPVNPAVGARNFLFLSPEFDISYFLKENELT